MKKPTQTDKLKLALKCLIENDPLFARQILTAMLAPAPVKPKGIDAVTIALGHGNRRFNPDDPKSVKAADITPCVLCKAPLKFARLAFWWSPHKPDRGYGHFGCVEKATANADRIFAELDAARVSAFDTINAAICACGHIPSRHRDDRGDLLECDMTGCKCDHFHYDIDGKEAATIDPVLTHDADGNRDDTEPTELDADWNATDLAELARINADMIEADDREMGIAD